MKYSLAFLAILLAAFLAATSPVLAQRIHPASPSAMAPFAPPSAPVTTPGLNSRIIAVVNDSIISSSDLNARMAMAFLSSGLPDTPEVRQHLLIQILHIMIDEQLQAQEAKKLDITVSQGDIDQALARISHDNNIPGGDIKVYLASHGIPTEALVDQIRSGLAWSKVIQRELRPRVDVGDDEVDAVLERQRANAGKEEYLVSEIFLAVDNPKDEDQVKQFAANLAQQLRQGGNFGAIARQFSQNANASAGGDIGWIQEGLLPADLNRGLIALKPGEITDPIRSTSGYHILGLRDKRTIVAGGTDTVAKLQQVFRPFGTDKDAVMKEVPQLRAAINSCADLKPKLAAQFPNWSWKDLGDVKLSAAPPWLAEQAHALPIGKAGEAMEVSGGALVVFVCDRKTSEGSVDRDTILDQIGTEKLQLQARGLLRDLRRDAYLDVRLNNTP